jgi:hypothetical protein
MAASALEFVSVLEEDGWLLTRRPSMIGERRVSSGERLTSSGRIQCQRRYVAARDPSTNPSARSRLTESGRVKRMERRVAEGCPFCLLVSLEVRGDLCNLLYFRDGFQKRLPSFATEFATNAGDREKLASNNERNRQCRGSSPETKSRFLSRCLTCCGVSILTSLSILTSQCPRLSSIGTIQVDSNGVDVRRARHSVRTTSLH